jgi:type II secretory pathway component GspD/PulD (secretin)
VYNVTDLLFDIPNYDAPTLPTTGTGGSGGSGGSGGGGTGGGGGFGGGGSGGGGSGGGGGGSGGGGGGIDDGDEEEGKSEEELMDELKGLIEKYITSPSGAWEWDDDGQHEIDAINGNFIIKQTPGVHRQVTSLLAKLREVRALQINVESRFLEIATDWFEQIGFDLDLYFNTNNSLFSQMQSVDPNAQLSDFFVPGTGQFQNPIIYTTLGPDGLPVPPGTNVATGGMFGTFDPATGTIVYTYGDPGAPIGHTDGISPLGIVQGSNQLIDTIGNFNAFGTLVSGSNPALGFGLQFLDDVQVDLMIEATQADKRNTVLTAPRLTMHNNQRAWISITTSVQYVSGLNLGSNSSAVGFTPEISSTGSGVRFQVHGVISADRRMLTSKCKNKLSLQTKHSKQQQLAVELVVVAQRQLNPL